MKIVDDILNDLKSNIFAVLDEELPSSFKVPLKKKIDNEIETMKDFALEYFESK